MFIMLFYSTSCEECSNIRQVIYNEKIGNMFEMVCIENLNSKQIASLPFKHVPAIMISAESQQSALHEGPLKCSQWLTNFTINRRKNLSQVVNQNMKLIQKAQTLDRIQNEGAIEYNEAEMDGVSDNYSYTGTDLYQPKNFVTVGREEDYSIVTPHLRQKESMIDSTMMTKDLAELESMRNADNIQLMNSMERDQIRRVLNPRDNGY
jgi:hypothetical protein